MNQDKLNQIIEFAKTFHEDDFIHGWQHILNVVENTKLIQKEEGGDLDVLITAAYLHDIGYKDNGKKDHNLVGANRAETFLKELNFENDFINHVTHCIISHRISYARKTDDKEARILCDADKLDQLGSKGTLRIITNRLKKGDSLKDALERVNKRASKIELFTKTAQKIVDKEQYLVDNFLIEFKKNI